MKQLYSNKDLFLKKEWNSDTCYNTNETWKHYEKWNKQDEKGQIQYDSTYEVPKIVKFIEKNRIVVTSSLGEGEMGVIF